MSAAQDAKNWFVLLKGKRYGPYTFAALAQAAEKGVVDPEAGVWCLGWDEWRIARNVPGLFKPEPEPAEPEEDADEPEAEADAREEPELAQEEPSNRDHRDRDYRRQDSRDRDLRDKDSRDRDVRDRGPRDRERRDEGNDRDATVDRGGNAADKVTPTDFAPGKPLVALGRLSETVELRARNRDADEADVKPDEAPGFDLSAGPPISASAPPPEHEPTSRGGGVRLAVISVLAVLAILFGAVWAAISLGIIRVEFMPARSPAKLTEQAPSNAQALPAAPAGGEAAPAAPRGMVDGIPDFVANLPAIAALKTADPDAYAKFVKRFSAVYQANASDDETLTRARTALRKSMKHLLAKASTESLLDITEVNLAYMRALQPINPGSCVALSDESKGATLDSNLARDFAPLFQREMAVLERIISSTASNDTAPGEAEVRPYLETVFGDLKKQPVQTQLLGRDKLTPAEYAPYCELVIAFYEAVRTLPFADAVKLLRNLYATAAAEPDTGQ
jgi:GYF domain 2